MSQTLNSLRLALERANSPADVALARMRYAIYLARMGDSERAKDEIQLLRTAGGTGLHSASTARANLAEGVLHSCNCDWDQSLDKLNRAKALSSFAGARELKNLANAWCAHIAFNSGRYKEIPGLASEVIHSAGPNEHSAISRLSVTLAAAYSWADQFDSARVWYDIGRRHAVAEQDDVTIEAILSNLPSFRIHHLFTAEITSSVLPGDIARARMEFESSVHYFGAKGWPSFRWMHPLLRLRLLVLEGRFLEAKLACEEWIASFSGQAPDRFKGDVNLDLAYCLAKTGDADGANRFESEALKFSSSYTENIEHAQVVFRRAQLAHLRGDSKMHEDLMRKSLQALEEYRRDRDTQRRALEGLQPPTSWL